MRRPVWSRALAALFALWFTVFTVEPVALHACDVHDAPRAAAAAGKPSHTTLIFTSDAGERRACDGCLPEGGTWEEVDVRAWCALLHHAEVMRTSANRE